MQLKYHSWPSFPITALGFSIRGYCSSGVYISFGLAWPFLFFRFSLYIKYFAAFVANDILRTQITSMKLHDCEAIEIEIWKCQGNYNRSWEWQECSENVLRNYIETLGKLYKNCIETIGKVFIKSWESFEKLMRKCLEQLKDNSEVWWL